MKKFFIFLISSFFLLFFSFLSVSQVGALTVNSRPPNVPTLPSPGDTLSVYVSASDIAYKGVYCNFVYGVEVTPSNHVDPDSQSKEVELLEGNWTSDSQIFVFDVVSDRCVTGSVPFTATPYWYYIRCDGTVEPGMFGSGETITLTEGIGSTLNVNVYKPDGSPASGATINISGTYSSSVTGSSAQFRRLNCSLNHTINASLNIGGVNCTASRSSCSGSSGCICNGDSRSLDLTLSCPASGLASLTATCPDGTPTLSANWNLSGSACDIYIYAGTSSYTISSNCTGSWTGTSLPGGPAIVPGGTYHLRASNETTTTDGGEATVNCASPPPSASPTPAPWGGCGSCPDDSCGSGATKRNCMDGAGNYSCQDWDKCVTDPWGVCKWDPGNCEDPWIDPTTDPKNCSDYTNTMYFTTVGPPPTYQDLPRNPEPGEAFNVHVLGGWGYMSIALDITKPSDPSGVTYTGRFTPGVPVSEYAAHWIFPISNAEASLNNTPYLFEFSHNIRSQYCVSKTLFVSPPVISPWIQTTGDVHSNERINAQGGPEDTITGIVCPGQTSIPRVTEGLISAYDLLENFGNPEAFCVIGNPATFMPYKIPTYEDLKSLYYTQSKAAKTDATPTLGNTANQDTIGSALNSADVVLVRGNLDINGILSGTEKTAVIFIDENLNIENNFTFGNNNTGVVFVVGGNVLIDKSVTQVDAVIISSGKIYTATNASANPIAITTCSSSSVPARQLVVNGSLISLDSSKPIEFCRKLANNSQPAEQIIQQPKYPVILRNLYSDTFQKWSEIE